MPSPSYLKERRDRKNEGQGNRHLEAGGNGLEPTHGVGKKEEANVERSEKMSRN